jgi:hypothetical protein
MFRKELSSSSTMSDDDPVATMAPRETQPGHSLLLSLILGKGSDYDYAEWILAHTRFRAWIKIAGVDPWVAWRWDESTALWLEAPLKIVEVICMRTLADAVSALPLQSLNHEQRNAFDAVRRQLLSSGKSTAITKLMTVGLLETTFPFHLDSIPFLLPFQNRLVYDLLRNEVRLRLPEDFFSIEFNVEYNPMADTTPTSDLILDICLGRKDLVEYLQKILGLALTVLLVPG